MSRQIFIISILLLLATVPSLAQPPRGLQLADLVRLKDVSDAQISPDGNQIAYVTHGDHVAEIFIYDIGSSTTKQIIKASNLSIRSLSWSR